MKNFIGGQIGVVGDDELQSVSGGVVKGPKTNSFFSNWICSTCGREYPWNVVFAAGNRCECGGILESE